MSHQIILGFEKEKVEEEKARAVELQMIMHSSFCRYYPAMLCCARSQEHVYRTWVSRGWLPGLLALGHGSRLEVGDVDLQLTRLIPEYSDEQGKYWIICASEQGLLEILDTTRYPLRRLDQRDMLMNN